MTSTWKLEDEWGIANCNLVATPHVKPIGSVPRPVGENEARAMSLDDTTLHRRAAARTSYIALDRPDLSFVSRVASSHMSNPAQLAWQTVVRSDMKEMGFGGCKVTNRVFTHRERDLRAVAHVDIFRLSGDMHDMSWFRVRDREIGRALSNHAN